MSVINPDMPTVIHADDCVQELNKGGHEIISKVMSRYESYPMASLHETLHGHIVTINRTKNCYVPGSEGKPARMTPEDAEFFLSLGENIRWFEMYTDRILLGIERVTPTSE